MEPEQIEIAISQVGADDEPEEAKERFRALRLNPPEVVEKHGPIPPQYHDPAE